MGTKGAEERERRSGKSQGRRVEWSVCVLLSGCTQPSVCCCVSALERMCALSEWCAALSLRRAAKGDERAAPQNAVARRARMEPKAERAQTSQEAGEASWTHSTQLACCAGGLALCCHGRDEKRRFKLLEKGLREAAAQRWHL